VILLSLSLLFHRRRCAEERRPNLGWGSRGQMSEEAAGHHATVVRVDDFSNRALLS